MGPRGRYAGYKAFDCCMGILRLGEQRLCHHRDGRLLPCLLLSLLGSWLLGIRGDLLLGPGQLHRQRDHRPAGPLPRLDRRLGLLQEAASRLLRPPRVGDDGEPLLFADGQLADGGHHLPLRHGRFCRGQYLLRCAPPLRGQREEGRLRLIPRLQPRLHRRRPALCRQRADVPQPGHIRYLQPGAGGEAELCHGGNLVDGLQPPDPPPRQGGEGV